MSDSTKCETCGVLSDNPNCPVCVLKADIEVLQEDMDRVLYKIQAPVQPQGEALGYTNMPCSVCRNGKPMPHCSRAHDPLVPPQAPPTERCRNGWEDGCLLPKGHDGPHDPRTIAEKPPTGEREGG